MFTIILYRNDRKRTYRFATLEDARRAANAYFARTGIVLGIEWEG